MRSFDRIRALSKKAAYASLLASCFLVMLTFIAPPAAALNNPYTIKNHVTRKNALFILSPDVSDPETAKKSRDYFSIFQQIVGSYWNLTTSAIEVNDYKAGLANQFDVVVVVDEFGEELPWALVNDIIKLSDKEVVHFGLGGDRLLRLVSFARTYNIEDPMLLDTVRYKGVELESGPYKQELMYSFSQRYTPPQGVTIQTPITAFDAAANELPAAIRVTTNRFRDQASGYLFFPFALPRYYDTQSYTNAVLDVLHLSFGNITDYPKQALVRLEDINAYTYAEPENPLFKAYDFLEEEQVPFHIALIARYIDPGKGIESSIADHRHFNYFLHKMVGSGDAVLVQHGYTHQYKQEVSGIGFEFWNDKAQAPAEQDSAAYAMERVQAAQTAMRDNNLPVPDIWETPHYALGPNANEVFDELYPLRYEEIQNVGHLPFPATINGTIYIPETLGYINGQWGLELPAFKKRLEQLQVFRNATPSFFWHPWRDTHELKTLVQLLQNQGYEFIHAYDLLETKSPNAGITAYQQYRAGYSDSITYFAINAGILGLYTIFLLGAARYVYDRFRFRRYFKLTTRFKRTLEETKQLYKKHNKPLPTFAIFVPARNEGLVIANTIENLASLDYPKDKYQIVIITDERELNDNVDILTKTEVERKAGELRSRFGSKLVTYIEIPDSYSGIYNDSTATFEKSTKGRALNYALQAHKAPKSWRHVDFIGVLDADGRLDKNVLKEAAWEALKTDAQILQGPVYQVSNLSQVSIVGVMAGLELARYHLTNMVPRLVHPRKIQFLAGTNYFIQRQLLEKVNGWDQYALVEDAELALRVYAKERVVANALTLPEIEQTPATFKIYRRQRERWARGHFEILSTILHAPIPITAKYTFIRKIVLSQFRFVLDLAIPLLAIFFLLMGYFREVAAWMQIASIVLIIAVIFMWDIYGQTYRRIARYSDVPKNPFNRLYMSMKLFVFMPAFMIIQAIPRINALYNFATRRKVIWAKTERTAEKPLNN